MKTFIPLGLALAGLAVAAPVPVALAEDGDVVSPRQFPGYPCKPPTIADYMMYKRDTVSYRQWPGYPGYPGSPGSPCQLPTIADYMMYKK
ncbi:hypothetical protein PG984_005305 [Apiospora sp. TS-2023a]